MRPVPPREVSRDSRLYLLAYKVETQVRLFSRLTPPDEMARLTPIITRIYAEEYLPGASGQALRPAKVGR